MLGQWWKFDSVGFPQFFSDCLTATPWNHEESSIGYYRVVSIRLRRCGRSNVSLLIRFLSSFMRFFWWRLDRDSLYTQLGFGAIGVARKESTFSSCVGLQLSSWSKFLKNGRRIQNSSLRILAVKCNSVKNTSIIVCFRYLEIKFATSSTFWVKECSIKSNFFRNADFVEGKLPYTASNFDLKDPISILGLVYKWRNQTLCNYI